MKGTPLVQTPQNRRKLLGYFLVPQYNVHPLFCPLLPLRFWIVVSVYEGGLFCTT